GGSIVVDDGSILGAGQFTQEIAQDVIAVTASAAVKIVFEPNGVAHRGDRRRDRAFRRQCTAEISVQHSAGEIVDGFEARGISRLKARQCEGGSVVGCNGETVAAQLCELVAY